MSSRSAWASLRRIGSTFAASRRLTRSARSSWAIRWSSSAASGGVHLLDDSGLVLARQVAHHRGPLPRRGGPGRRRRRRRGRGRRGSRRPSRGVLPLEEVAKRVGLAPPEQFAQVGHQERVPHQAILATSPSRVRSVGPILSQPQPLAGTSQMTPGNLPRNVLARNRTRPSTFGRSRAFRHTPRTVSRTPPGSRTRPCGFEGRRATDTLAGNVPRRESNPALDLRRIACDSGTPRGQQGARIRTPCASFGGSLLSQEHAPVDIVAMCPTGFEPAPSASQAGMLPATPRAQRKGRDSNPQGCSLARVPGGSRHRFG